MRSSLLLFAFLFPSLIYAQALQTGNLIPEYEKTYPVNSPGFETDTISLLKVVFDVNRSFAADEPNKLIETAARFLNMHEKAGVAPENMKLALVVHGKAVKDVLQDEFYNTEFPEVTYNPNLGLLEALAENGVKIIVCGQSAAHYQVTKEKADKNARFALSAMTALVQLQNDNYRIINF